MAMAATALPCDVEDTFQRLIEKEKNKSAKLSLETIIRNCELGLKEGKPICSDSGYPLYYVRLGDNVKIEGGFSILYEESKRAVAQLTAENILRPNMTNPFTGKNTGKNVGYYIPSLEIKFDPNIDFIDIIAIPNKDVAELELELVDLIHSGGIGAMGMGVALEY